MGYNSEIEELTRILEKELDKDDISIFYSSRCYTYQQALKKELVTPEQVKEARDYYGNLWNYTGD